MKVFLKFISGILVLAVVVAGLYLWEINRTGDPITNKISPAKPDIADDQSIRIVAIGDSGDGSGAQRSIAEQIKTEQYDIAMHLGDIVYPRGSYDYFRENFLGVYEQEFVDKMWPVIGNHDFASKSAEPYLDLFELPRNILSSDEYERYYSVDIGRLHLVGLDTNSSISAVEELRDDDMIDWLEQDLASVPDESITIVFFHHPPFNMGKHAPDSEVQEYIVPLLDKYNVPLVLSGHDHNYQRTCTLKFTETAEQCVDEGTVYIVSGGGSGYLYGLDEPQPDHFAFAKSVVHYLRVNISPDNSIKVEAVDDLGVVFDQISVN